MLVESQLNNNFKRFHEYVNNEVLWPRQISASKEYKWSQNGVQQSIKEAARRHNEDSTLESMVNSVKLTQDEESNVKQILELLKEGEIEVALNRTEIFKNEFRYVIMIIMIFELVNSNDLEIKLNSCKAIINKIKSDKIGSTKLPLELIYLCYTRLLKIGN